MKVKRILDEAYKSGVSQKTGKEWVLAKIETEDGESATAFQPIKVGDEVEVTENEYGKNARLSKPNPNKEQLDRIESKIDKLLGVAGDEELDESGFPD